MARRKIRRKYQTGGVIPNFQGAQVLDRPLTTQPVQRPAAFDPTSIFQAIQTRENALRTAISQANLNLGERRLNWQKETDNRNFLQQRLNAFNLQYQAGLDSLTQLDLNSPEQARMATDMRRQLQAIQQASQNTLLDNSLTPQQKQAAFQSQISKAKDLFSNEDYRKNVQNNAITKMLYDNIATAATDGTSVLDHDAINSMFESARKFQNGEISRAGFFAELKPYKVDISTANDLEKKAFQLMDTALTTTPKNWEQLQGDSASIIFAEKMKFGSQEDQVKALTDYLMSQEVWKKAREAEGKYTFQSGPSAGLLDRSQVEDFARNQVRYWRSQHGFGEGELDFTTDVKNLSRGSRTGKGTGLFGDSAGDIEASQIYQSARSSGIELSPEQARTLQRFNIHAPELNRFLRRVIELDPEGDGLTPEDEALLIRGDRDAGIRGFSAFSNSDTPGEMDGYFVDIIDRYRSRFDAIKRANPNATDDQIFDFISRNPIPTQSQVQAQTHAQQTQPTPQTGDPAVDNVNKGLQSDVEPTPLNPGEAQQQTESGIIYTDPDKTGEPFQFPFLDVIQPPLNQRQEAPGVQAPQVGDGISLQINNNVEDVVGGPLADLTGLVASYESERTAQNPENGFASAYDVPFGGRQFVQPPAPLTQLTMQELKDYQSRLIDDTKGRVAGLKPGEGTSASGKYQFTRTLLFGNVDRGGDDKGLAFRSGVDLFDDFTPEVQDRMFRQHLKELGIDDLIQKQQDGTLTDNDINIFHNKLSKAYASVPNTQNRGSHAGQPVGHDANTVRQVILDTLDRVANPTTQQRPPTTQAPSRVALSQSDQAKVNELRQRREALIEGNDFGDDISGQLAAIDKDINRTIVQGKESLNKKRKQLRTQLKDEKLKVLAADSLLNKLKPGSNLSAKTLFKGTKELQDITISRSKRDPDKYRVEVKYQGFGRDESFLLDKNGVRSYFRSSPFNLDGDFVKKNSKNVTVNDTEVESILELGADNIPEQDAQSTNQDDVQELLDIMRKNRG